MYIRTSSRAKDTRTRAIILACSVVAVLVIATQFFVPHFLPGLFTSIARPFWRAEFSVASGSLSSPASLLAQNEQLKRDIIALQVQQQSTQQLATDNADLMAMLGRTAPVSPAAVSSTTASSTSAYAPLKVPSGRILAAILVRPPFAAYDELVIDIGADHGIAVGSKIYAPGNILIGTTTDVLGQTSKVSLFSSPGESYSVLIGPGHAPATAIGRGGGQYEAQLPQSIKVSSGDVVSDSSLTDGPFGIVTATLANPADPFQTVLIAPPVNLYELRWVLVDAAPSISVPETIPVKATTTKAKK